MKFQLHNIVPDKGTVVFTWDDNLVSHAQVIAPMFEKFNCRCTFYINPGEKDFSVRFLSQYRELVKKKFEVGSHANTHCHPSSLTAYEFIGEMKKARDKIEEAFHIQPATFAFPYHESDEKMVSQVRNLYFETRNSLYNSVRHSLETAANIKQIHRLIESAIQDKVTLVFSGHGAFTENDAPETCGYEPIPSQVLYKILEFVTKNTELQICTFEQAALKTYLQYHCEMDEGSVRISESQIAFLKQYGLTQERILDLI